MIEDFIWEKGKVNHVKWGDARIFGEDSDVRKTMKNQEALKRFEQVWERVLEPEVRKAPTIEADRALELLGEKYQGVVSDHYQFREFAHEAVVFLARLNLEATEEGICDQLWSLGAHRDPTRLSIYFDTVSDKQRFDSLSARLNWNSRKLALRLVMDFMEKFDQSK